MAFNRINTLDAANYAAHCPPLTALRSLHRAHCTALNFALSAVLNAAHITALRTALNAAPFVFPNLGSRIISGKLSPSLFSSLPSPFSLLPFVKSFHGYSF